MVHVHFLYDTDAVRHGWSIDLMSTVPEGVSIDEFNKRIQYTVEMPFEILEENKTSFSHQPERHEAFEQLRTFRNALRTGSGTIYKYHEPRLYDTATPYAPVDPLGSENRVDQLLIAYAIHLCNQNNTAVFVLTGDPGVTTNLYSVRKAMRLNVYPLSLTHHDESAKMLYQVIQQQCEELSCLEKQSNKRAEQVQKEIVCESFEYARGHVYTVRKDNLNHRKYLFFPAVNRSLEGQCDFLETVFGLPDDGLFDRENISRFLEGWRFSKEVTETLLELLISPELDLRAEYVKTISDRIQMGPHESQDRLTQIAPFIFRLEIFFGWRAAPDIASPNGFASTFAANHANRLLWAVILRCASLQEIRASKIEPRLFLGRDLPHPPAELGLWLARIQAALSNDEIDPSVA